MTATVRALPRALAAITAELELDPETRWIRLDIIETTAGGPFDSDGVVAFEAFYREGATRGSMRERSRFVRENAGGKEGAARGA